MQLGEFLARIPEPTHWFDGNEERKTEKFTLTTRKGAT